MIGYIYQIINKIDGRRYIGQTINLEKRKQTHYNNLRNNKHPNYLLQNAWNEWGEENFIFVYEEIEIIDNDTLNQAEIDTIAKYDSYYNGYNRTPGGQGGVLNRKLSYENYCFIYYGCQWQGMTEKIANYLNIDSSTVSSILRGKSHSDYYLQSKSLTEDNIRFIQNEFKRVFNIPFDKKADKNRIPNHISEDEYYYCFCISSAYGRGIDNALAKYFDKHKSFLFNGLKNKANGKVVRARDRFLKLSNDESIRIGKQKFKEWELDKYSKIILKENPNDRWRN